MRLSDLKITDRDFDLSSGGAELVEYQYAVAQRLEARLDIGRGEWALDITFGVPYREVIFVKNPNLALVSSVFLVAIAGATGVVKINEYDIDTDFVTRAMTAQFEVESIWGPVTLVVTPFDLIGVIVAATVGPLGPFP